MSTLETSQDSGSLPNPKGHRIIESWYDHSDRATKIRARCGECEEIVNLTIFHRDLYQNGKRSFVSSVDAISEDVISLLDNHCGHQLLKGDVDEVLSGNLEPLGRMLPLSGGIPTTQLTGDEGRDSDPKV